MTALRPGASPPPVPIPMQRISDIGCLLWQRQKTAHFWMILSLPGMATYEWTWARGTSVTDFYRPYSLFPN
jgi:hypothetical protein